MAGDEEVSSRSYRRMGRGDEGAQEGYQMTRGTRRKVIPVVVTVWWFCQL